MPTEFQVDTHLAMTQTTNQRDVAAVQQPETHRTEDSPNTGLDSNPAVSAKALRDTIIGTSMCESHLEVLAALAEVKHFEPREAIVMPNDTVYPVMILISGRANVFGMFEDIVNVIEPGGLIGEIAFVDRKARSAAVVAKTACEVAVLSEDVITRLTKNRPEIVTQLLYNIGRELCSKLRSAQRLINAVDAVGGQETTTNGGPPHIWMLD
jgi:CRP-like cAMP-binding protein